MFIPCDPGVQFQGIYPEEAITNVKKKKKERRKKFMGTNLFAAFFITMKIWKQPKIVNNEGLAQLPITAWAYNSMCAISTKLF